MLVTDAFCFVDLLIRFWDEGSKVKVTAGKDPRTLSKPYLTNQRREFYPILVINVWGFVDVLVKFRS